ncbi:hypothetical protein ACGFZP_18335 [Kitasatospora sp. NPDC048239]|uniref:hypothetical protein n=1 Tax=Kitasatospora sp. NPDC048239 TaxID=3364046 RepID=UPI00371005BB
MAFALTAGGVAMAGLRAYRRRLLSATRWFAVALLPAGLYLSGLFPVARTIGGELADWATDLVFDPRVWTGLALLAVSAGLLVTTRRVGRRHAVEGDAPGPAAAAAAGPARPAVTATPEPGKAAPKAPKKPAGKSDDGLGDFADIEEILRRRGL